MNSTFRKIFLSVFAVVLFGIYAGYERMHNDSADLITLVMNDVAAKDDMAIGADDSPARAQVNTGTAHAQEAAPTSVSQPKPAPIPTRAPVAITRRRRGDDENEGEYEDDGYRYAQTQTQSAPKPSPTPAPAPAPAPTPAPTPAPAPAPVAKGQYKDGTYTGPSVNVFYGDVQIQAIVQGGKLASVRFLSYPSDRSTSRYINSQAMPILIQQALSAQSAQVDGVSGASDTSQGFIDSLGSALSQARA